MAVPKKKTSKSVSRTRKQNWMKLNVARIKNLVSLTKDSETGDVHLNHHVNPVTGKYRGKQVIDKSKELDKITTIKA